MDKIKVLDNHTAELIAAGEVVERPASVVKELMENSLDSGASLIVVEINNGGISYIRVTDNGCGMSPNDAKNAFQRHSTSKIRTAEDLHSIKTMGFRGEALSAISAVSKIDMFTGEKDSMSGSKMYSEGGKVMTFTECGCPTGTTIVVKDLFYNTPARLQFLKRDTTESSHIATVVDKIALSNPSVSVRFIKDGKEELFTAGDNNLISSIYSVYGRDFANGLLEVSYDYSGIKVSGFTTKPLNARPNRNMQVFFVNSRYIRSRLMTAAVEEAYKNIIMTGKFPSCILNVEITPNLVNVNVHPSKLEVKFSNDKSIFDAVYFAVKNALQKESGRSEFEIKQINPAVIADVFKADEPVNENAQKLLDYLDKINITDRFSVKPADDSAPNFNSPKGFTDFTSFKPILQKEEGGVSESENFRIIGELFSTYIVVEQDNCALLIDKHAAHERMIFEQLKKDNGSAEQQILLSPLVYNLSKEECSVLLNNVKELKIYGFVIEDFGTSSIIIREVPSIIGEDEIFNTICEIASIFKDSKGNIDLKAKDDILHTVACKAAIKAGSFTGEKECELLVKRLLSMPDVKYCPHGRPIVVELTKYNLEKMFRRIQ